MAHLGKHWERTQHLEIAAAVKTAVEVESVAAVVEELLTAAESHAEEKGFVVQECLQSGEERTPLADLAGIPVHQSSA